MKEKTGKAQAPHDCSRPSSKAVLKAVSKGDMDALACALTPRQVAFCREYVTDFIGADAVIRAGYAPKYAARQAYLLLRNVGVRKYIEHLSLSTQAKDLAINPDWVTSKAVSIIQTAERTSDQLRGLELVAKILGMLKDRTELSGPDGEAVRIINQQIEQDASAINNLIEALSQKRTYILE